MATKGIIFDFNGTLFFDSPLHILAVQKCFRTRGLTIPSAEEIVNKMFGMQNKYIYKTFLNPDGSDEDVEAFIAEKEEAYMNMFLEDTHYRSLCDGAEQMLDYLKENDIPFGIATGSEYQTVLFYVEHLGIDKWFPMDKIVYTDGTFKGKPEPDIYRIAASRLGLAPEECAVFEDGRAGLISAQAAGIGKRIAIYEQGMCDPLADGIVVEQVCHDLTDWKNILDRLGLLKKDL